MFNIIEGIFLPSCNIIKYYNMEKFGYNNYLAISIFKLLSFVVYSWYLIRVKMREFLIKNGQYYMICYHIIIYIYIYSYIIIYI